MKISILSILSSMAAVCLLSGSLIGCGGVEGDEESTDEALTARQVNYGDIQVLNGGDYTLIPGEEGGGAFATHTCSANESNSCTNFDTNCTSNGGTLTHSRGGLTSTCNCDTKSDGSANSAAMQCDNAVK